ncbi:MAG: glycosyltransferase 87 family protein [Crocinitomicaceae bacterium]|nr:glycosyltransferase 87 family protein [Crocinitomicaceae bacterium]
MWQSKTIILTAILVFLSAAGYVLLGYFTTQENFFVNFAFYSITFGAFIGLYLLRDSFSSKTLWKLTLFMHGILLCSIPTLSPDVYRFLWDGELIVKGIHPYAFTPNELVNSGNLEMTPYMSQLYASITDLSRVNYSVYPTLNQFYFVIPAVLTESVFSGILVMRIIMLLTLIIGIYFIQKTLEELLIPEKQVFLFALNPLLIIEATGNLHFEGVMFSLFAIAIYFMVREKWWISALFVALAINVKLTPLLLLPFFLNYLGWKKSMLFYLTTLSSSALLLMVFLWPSMTANFLQSVELYFNNFEFNSSFYRFSTYLFRPILIYDIAFIIGPLLSKIALIVILLLAIYSLKKGRESLFTFFLTGYVVYLFFSTTIHPWYLIIPLGFCVYTRYNFMIYWSFIVFLSYSFYALGNSKWVDVLVAIEYIGLLMFVLLEYKKRGPIKDLLARLPRP